MARRGARIKNDLPVIHALVVNGPSTQAEITRRAFPNRRRPSQSSVQGPIIRLVKRGLVRDKNELGKRRLERRYFLDPSKWMEIVQIYFPYHERENMTIPERIEFLNSDYADQIFDSEHFYRLLIKLFLKWAVDLDPKFWDDFESEARGWRTQSLISRIPDDYHQSETRFMMNKSLEVIPLVRRLKENDPDAKSEVETILAEGRRKKTLLRLLGISDELDELASLARLSPSLIGYAMHIDNYIHKSPLEFTFSLSSLPEAFDLSKDLDVQGVSKAGNLHSKEFRRFIWRFVLIMVIHDLIELPQQEVKMRMERAGVLSLQPYIDKVFNPNLPAMKPREASHR